MSVHLDFAVLFDSDDPAEWICEGGKPAAALGEVGPDRRCAGLPSYELESDFEPRGFQVFEFTIMQAHVGKAPMCIPRSYGTAVLLAPEGMVPVHHGWSAWWRYRPMLHDRVSDGWQTKGSQAELAWRWGLHKMLTGGRAEVAEMMLAQEKAEALLEEFLSDWQLADLCIRGSFRVRGGATGDVYEINVGDGFRRVDEASNEVLESFCLHPEAWLPDADVALATMWALEDPALEHQTLTGANSSTIRLDAPKVSSELAYARDMASELQVV